MSGYPDSHLSCREGSGPNLRRLLVGIIPLTVLVAWFLYMWSLSGVLVSVEKYPDGKIKAEGYVKRAGFSDYRRHGKWKTYHANGTQSGEGSYEYGEQLDDWVYWDDGGMPCRTDAASPPVTSRTGS